MNVHLLKELDIILLEKLKKYYYNCKLDFFFFNIMLFWIKFKFVEINNPSEMRKF